MPRPRQKRNFNRLGSGQVLCWRGSLRDISRMSDMTVRAIVTGRVQGVGFRVFVEFEARKRGLKGWVRNRRDGSVEAVFSGPAPAVEDMLAVCKRGPRSSRVDRVDVEPAPTSLLESSGTFAVHPTA
jgi:acylphosphatase